MSCKLNKIFLTFMIFIAAVDAESIVHFGYRLGGDGIVSNYTINTATTKGGYSIEVGGNIHLGKDFSVDLLSGYTLDFLTLGVENKTLMQIPFDAIVKYDAKIVHLGLGLTGTLAGMGTTFEFYPSLELLPSSIGAIGLVEFKLSQSFDHYLGLKAIRIFINSLGTAQTIQETEFYLGWSF